MRPNTYWTMQHGGALRETDDEPRHRKTTEPEPEDRLLREIRIGLSKRHPDGRPVFRDATDYVRTAFGERAASSATAAGPATPPPFKLTKGERATMRQLGLDEAAYRALVGLPERPSVAELQAALAARKGR